MVAREAMQQQRRGLSRMEEQIGRLLVEGGFINQAQLDEARAHAQAAGGPLRGALVSKNFLADETYSTFLSIQMRVPLVDLRQVTVSPDAVRLVPEELARRHGVLPLAVEGDVLRVAMDDPQDMDAINTLSTVTGLIVKARLPAQGSVAPLLDRYYKTSPQIEREIRTVLGVSGPPPAPDDAEPPAQPASPPQPQAAALLSLPAALETFDPNATAEDVVRAPVVKALDMIITQAVRDRASDVHIEPLDDTVRVRYRIDGVLQHAATLPKGVHSALVSRIKVMAGMDIAERRRPQDGHFNLRVNNEEVDFRIASIDTAYGEKVVLRVLNKAASILSLPDLGFTPDSLQVFQQLLASPYGMIMVSGPTGSGKTTTLYAALQTLDASVLNVMTVEDPIEYRFKGINQIQVNEQAGITFAGGLRAMMRMDPDVILLGEIRDAETATVAVNAALTGHLVLTTIHANDAAAAVLRLIDLGVEPFLATSAIVGSVAQRLVRKVCQYCKTTSRAPELEAAAYALEMGTPRAEFSIGRGCNMCARSGYSGRLGVFELMTMNDRIRKLLQTNATVEEVRAEAVQGGMVPLRRDGMLKARDGLTTPREIMRNVFSIT
jgi:type II secretory ATPase GspE/PulE/Tfp pilus assembly ATPase PilB-like protein